MKKTLIALALVALFALAGNTLSAWIDSAADSMNHGAAGSTYGDK